MPSVCQKAQANLAKVRETGSTWEFHIPRIDTWGYLTRMVSERQKLLMHGHVTHLTKAKNQSIKFTFLPSSVNLN